MSAQLKAHHIPGMTNAEYHADSDAVSSSMLKALWEKNPLHVWHRYLAPDREPKKPSKDMQHGTLLHAMVLEPEKIQEIINCTDKKALEDFDLVQGCANAMLATKEGRLLRALGQHEYTIYWIETVTIDDGDVVEIQCRARLDSFIKPMPGLPYGLIFDLKKTKDAAPGEFAKQIANLGYHIQAAWYSRAASALLGVPFAWGQYVPKIDGYGNEIEQTDMGTPFVFLAGEIESPHFVSPYKADHEMMRLGWLECEAMLKVIATCRKTGVWPGYTSKITPIKLPRWAKVPRYAK